MLRTRRLVPLALIALAFGCAQPKAASPPASGHRAPPPPQAGPFDAVTHDAADDPAFRAGMQDVAIASGESYMNGVVYVPPGPGPHPIAIVLHGYPGSERNGDLVQALRRAGWDVLVFHYRGSWGSEGKFSFTNALEDVDAAIGWVRSPRFVEQFRADPSRIALVGHSMGGFLALTEGAENPAVRCVASLAGANLGVFGAVAATPQGRAELEKRLGGWSGPIKGTSGKKLVKQLADNAKRFDTTARAAALAPRPVLLVAASRDEAVAPAQHHDPLVAAFAAAGAKRTTDVVLDADHAFSSQRVALTRVVVDWLANECLR
jgi:dipeptidyl aminopeptidase/acylaminoacyl peptidase